MEGFDVAAAAARLAETGGGYEVVHTSPGLEIGVYVLVAPEPDRRYGSAAELAQALTRVGLTVDAVEGDGEGGRAEGGAVLAQGGVAVRAVQIAFELEAQTVAAYGGVVVTQGASTLTGVSLLANLKTREADVFGDAHLVRAAPAGAAASGSQDTQDAAIRATHLRIRWGAVNEAEAEGSVIVRQGSIAARAQRARYSETAGRLVLEGEVVVAQFGDKEVTAGVTLTADQLVVLLRERDMEASGKVTVTQKGRTATGERGTYNEKEKRIILTGHVQMQDEEGNVIRADKVVIDLEAETFDASGNVETTFKVKRGK